MGKFVTLVLCITISIISFVLVLYGLDSKIKQASPPAPPILKIEKRGDSLVAQVLNSKPKATKVDTLKSTSIISSASYGPATMTYNENPKLMIWMILFSLMVAVSVSLAFGVTAKVSHLWNDQKSNRATRIISLLVGVLFTIALAAFNLNGRSDKNILPPLDVIYDLVLFFDRSAFTIIYLAQIVVFLVAGMTLSGLLLLSFLISIETKSSITIDTYESYNESLSFFVSVYSILIVFSIVTVSFINQAIVGYFINGKDLNLFPSEFVYGYGFIFSSILALIYIPIYQGLSSITDPTIKSAGSKATPFFGNYQSLISIIGPLLGSSISELIKNFSSN